MLVSLMFHVLPSVTKRLAIGVNIDTGDRLLLVGFSQDMCATIKRMRPKEMYVVKATEKPVGQYPSTFIDLKTHYYLNTTKVSLLPASTLSASKLSAHMASFETFFDRISELVLNAGPTRVSFRGVVIKSTKCVMPKGSGARSIIADESGQCIAFCQFNGTVKEVGSLMYCRLAQVYTDRNDHHIELSCVSTTFLVSDVKLINAPPMLQSFHRTNDMAQIEQQHNRSSLDDLEETTMAAMTKKIEDRYDIDAKMSAEKLKLSPSSSAAAASSSSSSSAAAASSSSSIASSSSSSSDSAYSPYSSTTTDGADESTENEAKYTESGYVTLTLKRIIAVPSPYYNACVHESSTSWGNTTCNKSVIKLASGQDWMDHKDRPAGTNVHRSQSCLQRYMFTAVFEDDTDSAQCTTSNTKEYPFKVFNEFGAIMLGMAAPEFAMLSTNRQAEIQDSLKEPAVYVVTISRHGIIENMQITQCSGETD